MTPISFCNYKLKTTCPMVIVVHSINAIHKFLVVLQPKALRSFSYDSWSYLIFLVKVSVQIMTEADCLVLNDNKRHQFPLS